MSHHHLGYKERVVIKTLLDNRTITPFIASQNAAVRIDRG